MKWGRKITGGYWRWLVMAGAGFLATVAVAGPAEERKIISCAYHFDAPQIETNGRTTRLTIAECQQLNRLGEPALPFRTARLLIPSGYVVEEAEVLPLDEPEQIKGTWPVECAGQPYSRPNPLGGGYMAGRNRRVYESESLYPPSPAELISVQRMAGQNIALVRVFPVRYCPSRGELRFSSRLNLRLTLARQTLPDAPLLRPPKTALSVARLAAFVDNPELLPSLVPSSEASAPKSGSPAIDYLLITSSNLTAAFQPLVDRKIKDGLVVKVVSVEWITNSVSGGDVPEKIRNYIRQAYTDWGISYVLLGGGTSIVPCRYAYVRADMPAKDSYLPCDLYYACLDGSWNGNGDKHWGEPTDGETGGDVDLLAEVYVGRAPVTTVEQVNTFVEKTIRYETLGNPNQSNALLMATYLGDFPTGPCQGADILNPVLPVLSQWHLDWLDDRPLKLPQWSGHAALAQMNRSPHVVLYSGYGDPDILMRMHTSDLTQLTNQWPFLACSVACSAGQFDHGRFLPDSFGETLVNGNPHGAFATILNARAGWFDPQQPSKYSGEFQARFFQKLLRDGGCRNLGLANQASKEDLVGLVENNDRMTYRWCYYGITLLGDPQVPFQFLDRNTRLAAGFLSTPRTN